MAVRDPHSPVVTSPSHGASRTREVELEARAGHAEDVDVLLRPHPGPPEPATLRRHLDACVAHAVGAGLSRGTAMAAHASVLESHGDDLASADELLVASLRQLLGIAPLTRQES